jgi:hypothetical protein
MLKKGDNDNDQVYDEVRTTVLSQNIVTATLSTEELLLRTHLYLSPHISTEVGWGGGQEIDGQHDRYR